MGGIKKNRVVSMCHWLNPPFLPESIPVDVRIKCLALVNLHNNFNSFLNSAIAKYESKLIVCIFCENRQEYSERISAKSLFCLLIFQPRILRDRFIKQRAALHESRCSPYRKKTRTADERTNFLSTLVL